LLVRNSWPLRLVAWLGVAAMALVVLSLVMLAQFSNAPPNSTYVPAHVVNGKFVPGVEK
jgi:hypothetical protein